MKEDNCSEHKWLPTSMIAVGSGEMEGYYSEDGYVSTVCEKCGKIKIEKIEKY